MKRMIVLFVAVSLLVGLKSTTAFANCEMLPIIKKDAGLTLRYLGRKNVEGLVLKVDKNSCWFYLQFGEDPEKDSAWFNVNQIDSIVYHGVYDGTKQNPKK